LRIIDEVFTKLKQVAEDLTKKFVDDVPNLSESELDWMAQSKETIGNLGGNILKASQIRKLRGTLKKKGIILIIENDLKSVKKLFKPIAGFDKWEDLFFYMRSQDPPYVGLFQPNTKQFFLASEATEIIVFHEMAHLKQFEELGEATYLTLSTLDKEMYVWNQILANRVRWTEAELEESLRYINRIRTEPKYGYSLEPIKIN
jgi:hypothetical protein